MARKKIKRQEPSDERVKAVKLSAQESLKRMQEFDKRKEAFVAALRKSKNRSVSP